MTRPTSVPWPIAPLAPFLLASLLAALIALAWLLLLPRPAGAQAGVEAAMLTSQSARTLTGQPGVTGPDWSATRRRAAAAGPTAPARPAARGRAARGRGQAPPPLLVRVPSGAPGKVGGLVYERGTKIPVANVTVALVSSDPGYVVTTLTARTDSAGYYEFAKVEPGRWTVSIPRDGLPLTWALPRLPAAIRLAKKQSYAAPPFALGRQTCVEGHAVWGDGYTLYDAPLTVIPLDTTLAATGGRINGVGDYRVCDAANDSVMVWMHLRDGRSLGRATRLIPGTVGHVEFRPEPIERMEGSAVRVLPVLADGTPVPRAQVFVVGRRFEQGDRPALVFVREDMSNREGVAEFKAPFGNYEVLVINPREGQAGSERMIVDLNQAEQKPLRIVLRGTNSEAQREALKNDLFERAETSLYVWGQ
jgi:hypothetical protein